MTNKKTHPVIAIIQAHMGSTRLPGKVMLEVSGKPVIQYVLERLKSVRNIDDIVSCILYLVTKSTLKKNFNYLMISVLRE